MQEQKILLLLFLVFLEGYYDAMVQHELREAFNNANYHVKLENGVQPFPKKRCIRVFWLSIDFFFYSLCTSHKDGFIFSLLKTAI